MASSFTQNYVLSQSLTLSFFILGMGFGSYVFQFFRKKTAGLLFKIEILLFFTALAGFLLVQAGQVYTNNIAWTHQSKIFFLLALVQLFVFTIGALSGMEIPFFMQLKDSLPGAKNTFGRILAFSYLGSFGASYLTVALMLPDFGFYNTFNCILILILVSCYLLTFFITARKNIYLGAVLVFLLINAGFFVYSNQFQQIYLKNYYYGHSEDKPFWQVSELPSVERHSTPYQEIDVVPDLFSYQSKHHYYLFIDQKLQYASRRETVYHESMVHGAVNLARRYPKKVLVLGGGEGLVVRELLKYNSIESIDLVELDQAVLDLAESNPLFLEQNQNALFDSRVHIHVADAYMWVKNNSSKFDAVFIDLPHPYSVELSRLFSYEFYSFVKRSLTADGFVILDYPVNHLLNEDLKYQPPADAGLIYRTLAGAGLQNTFTYGPKESFIFARASGDELSFEEESLFSKVHDMALSNLIELPQPNVPAAESPELSSVNSVFKPYFLTE
jgi:spermidine synthase